MDHRRIECRPEISPRGLFFTYRLILTNHGIGNSDLNRTHLTIKFFLDMLYTGPLLFYLVFVNLNRTVII